MFSDVDAGVRIFTWWVSRHVLPDETKGKPQIMAVPTGFGKR
jgi:hypothetical protein